jgi:iron complex transport system substrate-binding protein
MMRFLLCALALVFAGSAEAAPQRIVSLDYCADQYVLGLADRAQIAALSRGSQRDDAYYRDRARGLNQTRGSLEEVLALHPDLVVRNWGGPWDAPAVYARFHTPVLEVGDVHDFAAARRLLLRAAIVMGQKARGETLARDLDIRLARLAENAPAQPPPTIYLSAAGAVAGSGVMLNAVIESAGGRNAWRGEGWTILPLERLVETPPAFIATGFFDTGRTHMNAWSPSRNPVFVRMLARARRVDLPAGSISCEAWTEIDAAEILAAALKDRR